MGFETHSFMDGKLHVYRRENSRFWQCASYLGGRNHRQTTKETSLREAKEFAEAWYHELRVADRVQRLGSSLTGKLGQIAATERSTPHVGTDLRRVASHRRTPNHPADSGIPTFKEAAEEFVREYEVMTAGERNAIYVRRSPTTFEFTFCRS